MKINHYKCDKCGDKSEDRLHEFHSHLSTKSRVEIKLTVQTSDYGSLTWSPIDSTHICQKCQIEIFERQIKCIKECFL